MTPRSISPSSTVVRSETPLSADVGGRTVLMSVDQGQYYDLDAISSDVWHRLASPVQVSGLCAALCAAYDGAPAAIEADVIALLHRFAEQGLINVSEANCP